MPRLLPTCSVRGDISTPRRGRHLWRLASLIPSGCRLPPIHKVMGDHASRGPTPAGASPLHGLSRLFISDCHSPCPFSVSLPRYVSPCAEFLNKLAGWYLAKWQCVSELRKSTHAKSHEKTWDLAGLFVMNNDCKYLIIS